MLWSSFFADSSGTRGRLGGEMHCSVGERRKTALILSFILLGLGLFAFVSAAKADTYIDWTVNAAFNDGGTITGSFIVDTNTLAVLSGSLTTSSTGTFSGATYTAANISIVGYDGWRLDATSGSNVMELVAHYGGQTWVDPPTGGTITLPTSDDPYRYGTYDEGDGSGGTRLLTSGTAVGTNTTNVPGPIPGAGLPSYLAFGLMAVLYRFRLMTAWLRINVARVALHLRRQGMRFRLRLARGEVDFT